MGNTNKLQNGFKLQGKYRFKVYKARTWLPKAVRQFMVLHHLIKPISVSPFIHNLIVLNSNHGLNLIFQHLEGTTIYPLELDKAAIGTGTATPTDADTALQTPVLTGILKARATLDDLAELATEWFIADDELANGTYNEFALYCDTQLFCRSIISPAQSKATGQDILVEYTITGTNT